MQELISSISSRFHVKDRSLLFSRKLELYFCLISFTSLGSVHSLAEKLPRNVHAEIQI